MNTKEHKLNNQAVLTQDYQEYSQLMILYVDKYYYDWARYHSKRPLSSESLASILESIEHED